MKMTPEQLALIKPMPPFIRPLRDAIREGRKTQTRRTNCLDEINKNPDNWRFEGITSNGIAVFCDLKKTSHGHDQYVTKEIRCPYGKAGDIRYLREPLCKHRLFTRYADDSKNHDADADEGRKWEWQRNTLPQIHMPKIFARTFIRIEEIGVQRVQDITEADALAEAVAIDKGNAFHVVGHEGIWAHATARGCFETIFDHINKEPNKMPPFDRNVFVWVVKFQKIK